MCFWLYNFALHWYIYSHLTIFKFPTLQVQLRTDGNFGFPGGLVDPGDANMFGALNRECSEEMALDLDLYR